MGHARPNGCACMAGDGAAQCGCRARDANNGEHVVTCEDADEAAAFSMAGLDACIANSKCFWGGKDTPDGYDARCVQKNKVANCKCPGAQMKHDTLPCQRGQLHVTFMQLTCTWHALDQVCT